MSLPVLRDYQETALSNIRRAFGQGAKKVLFQGPTGMGKTVLFTHMARGSVRKGRSTLILTHREELVDQISKTLQHEHGVIAAEHLSKKKDRRQWEIERRLEMNAIVVASIQTLHRNLEIVKAKKTFDYVVIDEAHHGRAKTWEEVLEAWPAAKRLGVTATPARLDGKGLGSLFDVIITGPSVKWLIAQGWLSPYRYIGTPPDMAVDLSGVKKIGHDYSKKDLAERVDRPVVTGDALAHYREHGGGKPFLVFAVSVEHAQHLAEEYTAAGFPARSIDGKMRSCERRAIVRDFRNGNLLGLTNCQLVGEGFDVPEIVVCQDLGPTLSLGWFLQKVGRALRAAEGKEQAIILDHAGNWMRHGLPCDERTWTLKDGAVKEKGNEKGLRLRQCPNCDLVHDAAALACPGCGHVYEVERKKVPFRDGKLVEIKPGMRVHWEDALAGYRRARNAYRWRMKQNGVSPQAVERRLRRWDMQKCQEFARTHKCTVVYCGQPEEYASAELYRQTEAQP